MSLVHIHDAIRDSILKNKGLKDKPNHQGKTLEELRKSEWSKKFEELQRNRLVIGAFRYGLLNQPGKKKFDRINYIEIKLGRYKETGNLETLVDIANLAMLEFEEGKHPERHFKALDDTDEHAKILNGD